MIVCPNCGKENQDHYKFCLGCGAKLPAPGQAPSPPPPPVAVPPPAVTPPAPSYAPPVAHQPPQPQPPPAPQAPAPQQQPYAQQQPGPYGQPQQGTYGAPSSQPSSAPQGCPSCGTVNPPQFKFCGACGNKLGAPSSAPQPPSPPGFGDAPAPAPDEPAPAKTMFMDATQRPQVGGGVATVRLILMREDGTEGGVLVIEGGPESIGRAHGPPFDADAYLDPSHANLTATHEGLLVDSAHSLNGVYIKLEGRAELQHQDYFRVGQELLYYEDLPEPTPTPEGTERMGSPNPGYWGRVSVMVGPQRAVAAYPILDDGVEIGRESGHITFPDDGYVSGSHCRIVGDDEGVFLEDLGSSNGTYMRVRPDQLIRPGTLILIGQQLFRVEFG